MIALTALVLSASSSAIASDINLTVWGMARETKFPLIKKDGVVMIHVNDLAWNIGGNSQFFDDYAYINYGEVELYMFNDKIVLSDLEEMLASEDYCTEEILFETMPFIHEGAFYVPLTETVERLTHRVKIDWKNETSTVNLRPKYTDIAIEECDAKKVSYEGIKRITITCNDFFDFWPMYDKPIVLEEKDNINEAVVSAEMLPFFNFATCRCMTTPVDYKIEYYNGKTANVSFRVPSHFEEIFWNVFTSKEARKQIVPIFDEKIVGKRFLRLHSYATGDVVMDSRVDGEQMQNIINLCREYELEKVYPDREHVRNGREDNTKTIELSFSDNIEFEDSTIYTMDFPNETALEEFLKKIEQ